MKARAEQRYFVNGTSHHLCLTYIFSAFLLKLCEYGGLTTVSEYGGLTTEDQSTLERLREKTFISGFSHNMVPVLTSFAST